LLYPVELRAHDREDNTSLLNGKIQRKRRGPLKVKDPLPPSLKSDRRMRVIVHRDHITSRIETPNHGIM
jgi:hypothetical protein